MRLCRYSLDQSVRLGFFENNRVVDAASVAAELGSSLASLFESVSDWLEFFPLDSPQWLELDQLYSAYRVEAGQVGKSFPIRDLKLTNDSTSAAQLLPPIGQPPKLLLLAGNYFEHIAEQGDLAAERVDTFPYVFMKPPSTTLIGSGQAFQIPSNSPNKIDYELELAVIIGKGGFEICAADAMRHVAGYTVVNDISDRGYRPNPNRKERPRDKFFDWLHGKWHKGSCPCGPCWVSQDEIQNPHDLTMRLSIDGEVRQDANSSQQVFTIAETIEFISSFVELEPGDMISTGTPSGVGNATGRYLRAGQIVEATIESIGSLITPIV